MQSDPVSVSGRFQIPYPVRSASLAETGHINQTWFLYSDAAGEPCCVLQKINTDVFRDPEGVMSNIAIVLDCLSQRDPADPAVSGFVPPRLIPSEGGGNFYRDPEGGWWRMYDHIPGSRTYDMAEVPEMARQAGRVLGLFQKLTASIPGSSLKETIPFFHNIRTRLQAFRETAGKDLFNRAVTCAGEIAFAEARSEEMQTILRLGEAGKIPLRITHNDPKFNNILFDSRNSAISIIDLDTVMPGFALYDFGDAIRTGASAAAEDEPDLTKVGIRMDLFKAYAEGYLSVAASFLEPEETRQLVHSVRFMTFLIGLRFLTDHLDGDRYFRIRSENHNLVRACSQFRLVKCMEDRAEQMEKIIYDHLSTVK